VNVQPENVGRRRRKPVQRRVPTLIEQPERKPVIFGWGGDLSQRDREMLKERIALFAGIAIAVIVIGLIAWGAVYDGIIKPANERAADNKPVAIIGAYTVTTGFFKRVENLQNTSLNNNITQLNGEISQLNADPKKNAAQLAQAQQQLSQLQAQQGSLATNTLELIVDDQIAIQRAASEGIKVTPKVRQASLEGQIKAAGGPKHFQQFVDTSGLSMDEMKSILLGDYLQQKLQARIAAHVSHTQLEVRASHILVATNKKALAEKLYREVKGGASIATLARKYSIDKTSAVKGGDLGYFPQGQMVAPFDKAAFSMKVGEVRLVKSQFGWHIIKVTGHKTTRRTPSQYQGAQANAYQSWLSRQKTILNYQEIVAPSSLPGVATPTPNTVNQILPTALVQPTPAPAVTAPVATPSGGHPATKPATSKTGTAKKP
jgi:hypothetical protein